MLKKSRSACWRGFCYFGPLSQTDTQNLLSQLEDFDFRYMKVDDDDGGAFSGCFANWLFKCVRSTTLISTPSASQSNHAGPSEHTHAH